MLPLQREMDTLFATILDDGHNLVSAAKCSLFFVDEEKGELWTKVATDDSGVIKVCAFPINTLRGFATLILIFANTLRGTSNAAMHEGTLG